MTKQQELEIYKIAWLDWLSITDELLEITDFGFCKYFNNKEFSKELESEIIKITDYRIGFPTLYSFRKTEPLDDLTNWWFPQEGSTRMGRKDRIEALEKAIEFLENELKNEQQ